MSDDAMVALTQAMADSGRRMDWGDVPTIDKHSTGGVGDKVSLVLAPLWASLGRSVPMISGRGLGLTGGTLDKLEAIPGFRTDLDADHLRKQLREVGCFISGQTSELAPADRVLYALRNETSTVPSIPLIVGSILSKKLAAGVGTLVLDVKVGSGAFMQSVDRARALAEALVRVGLGAGMATEAHLTAMDRPLGLAAGNAVEVNEAVACLRGGGPADLRALVLAFAGPGSEAALDDGRAFACFERMVVAQGGDAAWLGRPRDPSGIRRVVVRANRTGLVAKIDAGSVGRAVFGLGAGRASAEEAVDPEVGVVLQTALGAKVQVGDEIAHVLHRDGRGLEAALAHLDVGIRVDDMGPVGALDLIVR